MVHACEEMRLFRPGWRFSKDSADKRRALMRSSPPVVASTIFLEEFLSTDQGLQWFHETVQAIDCLLEQNLSRCPGLFALPVGQHLLLTKQAPSNAMSVPTDQICRNLISYPSRQPILPIDRHHCGPRATKNKRHCENHLNLSELPSKSLV